MGASKGLSIFLRIWELISSLIVLGIVAHFFSRVKLANANADSRLIFTISIASISTAVSLLFMMPFTFTFMACPLDFILFVLWLVAFILLELLTGNNTCNSYWYYNYWGYYWGGYWRTPIVVTGPASINWAGCSSWRVVLAWSFMASMAFLGSSILGVYVVVKYKEEKRMRQEGYYSGASKEQASRPPPQQQPQPPPHPPPPQGPLISPPYPPEA
ncbi:hypothetical protein GE09DRAFT_1133181 [Coniochaeta sp. 2T2.1]|nr:hypothetical protein GE09DRAFT_1133181 [Coniochaeta sp. 2T2.1]